MAMDTSSVDSCMNGILESLKAGGKQMCFLRSGWKFGWRVSTDRPQLPENLWLLMKGRPLIICGCPLGGQPFELPSFVLQTSIVLDCVGQHNRETHYGFCRVPFVTDNPSTWQVPSDADAVEQLFFILHHLKQKLQEQNVFTFNGLLCFGQSAGCQILAAIASGSFKETNQWKPLISVFIAPAFHQDLEALLADSWMCHGYIVFLCHQYDSCCKWRDIEAFIARLQNRHVARYLYVHILKHPSPVPWGRQCHNIGYSLLSLTSFWNLCQELVTDSNRWSNLDLSNDAVELLFGRGHELSSGWLLPGAIGSEFALNHCFCVLFAIVCESRLSSVLLQKMDESVIDCLKDKFKQSPMTWELQDIRKVDIQRLIQSFPQVQMQTFLKQCMDVQFAHSALHAAIHVRQTKQKSRRDSMCEARFEQNQCTSTSLVKIGDWWLVEISSPQWMPIQWYQEGQRISDREFVGFGFMDMMILSFEMNSQHFQFIGAFVHDLHKDSRRAGKKPQHHRDMVRSISLLLSSASWILQDKSINLKAIVVIKTGNQLRASQRFAASSLKQPRWFAMSCGQKDYEESEPANDSSLLEQLRISAAEINSSKGDKNDVAIQFVKSIKTTPAVVIGPPGTGKTSLAATMVKIAQITAARRGRSESLLMVCSTFEAGMNFAETLRSDPSTEECGQITIVLMMATTRVARLAEHINSGTYKGFKVAEAGDSIAKVFSQNYAPGHILVVLATYGITHSHCTPYVDRLASLRNRFAYVFADEGGQVGAVGALPIFGFAKPDAAWFVQGDPRQLPPFSSNGQETPNLLRTLLHSVTAYCLKVQRRMTPSLGAVVSHAFYEGSLTSEVVFADQNIMPSFSMVVLKGISSRTFEEAPEGRGNPAEARFVAELAHSFADEKPEILTYYANQKRLILKECQRIGCDSLVHCVDGVQGREYSHTIISAGRCFGIGFVADRRRLTVAISRARKSVILVCTKEVVEKSHAWAALGELAERLNVRYDIGSEITAQKAKEDLCSCCFIERQVSDKCTDDLQSIFNSLQLDLVGPLEGFAALAIPPFRDETQDTIFETLQREEVRSDSESSVDSEHSELVPDTTSSEEMPTNSKDPPCMTNTFCLMRITKLHRLSHLMERTEAAVQKKISRQQALDMVAESLGLCCYEALLGYHNADLDDAVLFQWDRMFPRNKVTAVLLQKTVADYRKDPNLFPTALKTMINMFGMVEMTKNSWIYVGSQYLHFGFEMKPVSTVSTETHNTFNTWIKNALMHLCLPRIMVVALCKMANPLPAQSPDRMTYHFQLSQISKFVMEIQSQQPDKKQKTMGKRVQPLHQPHSRAPPPPESMTFIIELLKSKSEGTKYERGRHEFNSLCCSLGEAAAMAQSVFRSDSKVQELGGGSGSSSSCWPQL